MSRHRRKILIVDDQLDLCEALCEILTQEGYDSQCAENGQEALNNLKARKVHLILLDWQMPIMGGAEFLARKKASVILARIPVIVLSAAANLQSLLAAAGVPFIQKPIDLTTLLAAIDRLIV